MKIKKRVKKVLMVCSILGVFCLAPVMSNSSNAALSNVGSAIESVTTITAQAAQTASFSEFWYQNADGTWSIKDGTGNTITNAWVCEDKADSKDSWYLIDAAGKMVSAPLVQDGTQNFYSLETQHNGRYGMIRFTNSVYDGISLQFDTNHNGSFGKILNQDGIDALKSQYGVTSVANIDNTRCYYTSQFSTSGTPSGQTLMDGEAGQQTPTQNQDNKTSPTGQTKRGYHWSYEVNRWVRDEGYDPGATSDHYDFSDIGLTVN